MKEQKIKNKVLPRSFDMRESHRFCTDFSASLMLARKACLPHWAHFAFSCLTRFPTCVCFAEGLAQ